ncbi:hypothetical protein sos41_12040 [Alphaproteobacteria bacterium SO-S41]|nr:hypothetical protein sos41_12040 [Alphaproteobacteria bacterium SO-S41]
MLDFLKDPTVQGALLAALLAVIAGVSAVAVSALNRFKTWIEGDEKKSLADASAAHGVAVTDGVDKDNPIPVDRLGEVVANAKAYAVEMNPELARKMHGFSDRMLTRLTVEDAPAAEIKAAAASGDLETPSP